MTDQLTTREALSAALQRLAVQSPMMQPDQPTASSTKTPRGYTIDMDRELPMGAVVHGQVRDRPRRAPRDLVWLLRNTASKWLVVLYGQRRRGSAASESEL